MPGSSGLGIGLDLAISFYGGIPDFLFSHLGCSWQNATIFSRKGLF